MTSLWFGELERKVDDKGRVAISDFPLGHHVYAYSGHVEGHDALVCYTEPNFKAYAELVPREELRRFHTLNVDADHRINFNGLAKFTPHGTVLIEGRGKYFFLVQKPQTKPG